MTSPQDQNDDPLLGTVLAGRYRIVRLLGRGGMGSVYQARQLGLDRDVALKVLRSEFVRSTRESERFRREALAMARLRHPNIVTVYDFGVSDSGLAYLAMEYLTGPTLDRWLVEHGPGAIFEGFEIVRPICLALDASHRAGIVHRDLKPANIILPDPSNPDDALRVVDFGIARLRELSDEIELTGHRMLGTPAYMAPEQIEAARVDARSDIYAIGLVAFEVLAGRRPFGGATGRALLFKHISEPPPRLSDVRPGLSPAVDDVLLRALAKEPADRYETAREFADALGRALGLASADEQIRTLRSIVERDELTQLFNRRAFYARLAEAKGRADREGSRFAVAIVDVDDFKAVNDTYGHLAGDGTLRIIASSIASSTKPDDVVCRYAGDEFAIILHVATEEAARSVLDAIRERVRESVGARFGVSVSVGATLYAGTDAAPEVIVGTADRALYAAKRAGKDAVQFLTIDASVSMTPAEPLPVSEIPTVHDDARDAVTVVRRPRRLHFDGFVGRERETAAIAEAIGHAHDGSIGAALVVGDAGLGKSALAAHAVATLHDVDVLETRFLDGAHALPFSVFVEPLGVALGADPSAADEVSSTPAEAQALAAAARGDASGFAEALDLGRSDTERYRAHELLRRVYMRIARDRLTVLLVEDLQWADSLSLEFLTSLVGGHGDARLFVLATARADALVEGAPLRAWARGLGRSGRLERIELGPLRAADVRAMIESLGGRSPHRIDVPDALVRLVARETDGNPLFIHEVLRLWASDGTIRFDPEAGTWALGQVAGIVLPPSVSDLYEARLAQLDPGVVDALRVAAVVGEEFALDVLAAADGSSEDDALDLVEEAVRAGLVVEIADRRDDAFRFAHTIARRVLAESLTGARRRRLHGRIADALEARRSRGLPATDADLARHLLLANRSAEAVRYAIEAAQAAWRAWALEQTEEALATVDAARDAGAALDPAVAARAETLRGETEAMRGRPVEAIARLEGALAALDAAGEADGPLRTRTLGSLGRLYAETGQSERARDAIGEAMRSAAAAGDDAEFVRLHVLLGQVQDYAGEFAGALEAIDAARDLARSRSDRVGELAAEIARGQTLCRMGRYGEALEAGRRASELAIAVGDPKREWQAHNLLGIVYHERADSARAFDHFVRACDGARAMGDLSGEVRALINIGESHRREGNFDDAIACYEQILAIAPDVGARFREGLAVNLALAYTGLGNAAAAERHLEEARELNAATGDLFAGAYIRYAAAEALLLVGDADGAAEEAEHAAEQARTIRSPEVEWHALWAAARAERRRGDGARERERLAACARVLEAMADQLHDARDRERFLADKRAVFEALEGGLA